MVHWASTYRTVGRVRTISANVTESRMKTAVKTKAQPGIVRRQHPQGQHGGGGGGGAGARPGCIWCALSALASCRIPRFLLGLLARVGDFMQTLHLIEKVCIKSACRLADFSKVCIVCKTQTFEKKCASSLHQVCTKSAKSALVLHIVCIRTIRLSGTNLLF